MQSYKDLIVWQKSVALTTDIYDLTSKFPREEIYGLTNQMRRAVVSIPSNIAEGCGRGSRKEYVQFFRIALGSAMELETQITISERLNFVNPKDTKTLKDLLTEVMKMLNKLISTLASKN